ncbi:ECF RNA polymerase sigma factor RpoE [Enhygromyxa salina]|uniref:ECF RNA polymerase sigma factor RpoE n=1 Tax=Enhygromyxa salina TaxID=215803 RepID=A0A2S9XJC7_9BACT|nr:sigma-70 family RNA polymerase sigma factor [Enhygromyxa salina]PRP92840.1 ECF RNA polymerase sigma factor RpoE [Enhygromyxa salina]
MASDAELLVAWSKGDQVAGEELFERHYEAVSRFFRNKSGDEWSELCQRTFLACVESLPRLREQASFRSFLFGIAYRQLYRFYRERAYDQARLDFATFSLVDLNPKASSIVAARQEEQLLLTALRRIPLDYQVILELHYWEDMTAKACAEALGLPLGTAKTRLRRARQLLEVELGNSAESPEVLTKTLTGLDDWARGLRAQLEG